MVLGRVVYRDRGRLALIAAALFLASAAAASMPGFLAEAPRSTIASVAGALQPDVSLYLAVAGGGGGLESLADVLEGVEPGPPVTVWGAVLVAHVFSEYHVVGEVYPSGEGYDCMVVTSGGVDVFQEYDTLSSAEFSYKGYRVSCEVGYYNIAAAAPLGPAGLEALGASLDAGRWPRPGGDPVEAALSAWLAERLHAKTGDVVELFPGFRVRVVGVFTPTPGLSSMEVPLGYTFARARLGIVVAPGDLDRLAEAVGEWASEALGDPKSRAMILSLLHVSVYEAIPPGPGGPATVEAVGGVNSSLPEYRPNMTGVIPGALALSSPSLSGLPGLIPQGMLGGVGLGLLYRLDEEAVADMLLSMSGARPDIVARRLLEPAVSHLERAGLEFDVDALVYGGLASVSYDSMNLTVAVDTGKLSALWNAAGIAYSPLAVTAMLSGVLLVLLAAARGVSDTLQVIVEDLRGPIALLVARGGSRRSLTSSLRNLLAAVGAATALAGGLASTPLFESTLEAALAASLIVVLLSVYTAYRRAARIVDSVDPVEAVRPAMRAGRVEVPRRRLDTLIAGLSLLALIVGLHGDPEGIIEAAQEHGTLAVALAVVAVATTFMFTPFLLPALVKSAGDLLLAARRLDDLAVAAASKLAGNLSWAARSGSSRLKARIAASVQAPATVLGAALAAALAGGYASSAARASARLLSTASGDVSNTAMLVGSLDSMASMLRAAAIFLGGLGLVSVYMLSHSALGEVSREIVVARARGASRGQALRLALGLILPPVLASLLIALVLGALGYLAAAAVARFYSSLMGGPGFPLALPAGDSMVMAASIAAGSLAVPVLLAYARAAPREVAGALRRLGWG